MTNVTRRYLRDTEEFLAIALAAEKVVQRGTSRNRPAAQPRKAEPRKLGGIKRALRGMFGGDL